MKGKELNLAAFALTSPQSREDSIFLLREIIACLDIVDGHLDDAFARCENPEIA